LMPRIKKLLFSNIKALKIYLKNFHKVSFHRKKYIFF